MARDGLGNLRRMGDALDRQRTPDARLLDRLGRGERRTRLICVQCRTVQSRHVVAEDATGRQVCHHCGGTVAKVED